MCGCKGICYRYKADKPKEGGRYSSSQKRCQVCEIYINWEGLWCACCGMRLRTKPRNLKYKDKYKEAIKENGKVSAGVNYEELRKQED